MKITPHIIKTIPVLMGIWLLAGALPDHRAEARGPASMDAPVLCNQDLNTCHDTELDLDPRRSLFVTDLETVHHFTLERVMDQLVRQSAISGMTALTLWQQWWDTEEPSPGLGLGPNCDDQVDANGNPVINDFPITCPRVEGTESNFNPFMDPETNPAYYKPLALVNRLDLAPQDGAHCGEYRIIYGRKSGEDDIFQRNLIIFESVMPNPYPDQGVAACRPVARFWANLSRIDDPHTRARRLFQFYFRGLPRHGFAPVIHINHFGPGTGQIRSNQFMQQPWLLRDWKLVFACTDPYQAQCSLTMVPVTVKTNPFGELFDDTSPHLKAPRFQTYFPSQVPNLMTDDLNGFSNQIPDFFNAGESPSQGNENNYPFHLGQGNGGFSNAIQDALDDQNSDLTPTQIARRSMAMSCAGCHQLSANAPHNDLGHGLIWPAALGFTHISERTTETLPDGTLGFEISPALKDVFLPHRLDILKRFLTRTACASLFCPAAPMPVPPPYPITITPSGPTTDRDSASIPTPEEVEALDRQLKAGESSDTLGGPRRIH